MERQTNKTRADARQNKVAAFPTRLGRYIINCVSDQVYYYDGEGQLEWANNSACAALDRKLDELAGAKCDDIWVSMGNPRPDCIVKEAIKTATVQETTTEHPGGGFWTAKAYPLTNEANTVVGVIIVARDTVSSELSPGDPARPGIVTSAEGLIVIQDYRIIFANPAVARISGYDTDALFAMDRDALRNRILHPDDRARVWDHLEALLRGEDASAVDEFRITGRNGDTRWVETRAVMTEFRGRSALRITFLDVTDRWAANDALRRSEEHFRSVAQTATDAIFTTDREMKIVFANDAVKREFGYSPEDAIGEPLDRFLLIAGDKPGGPSAEMRDDELQTGESAVIQRTLGVTGLRKNGERFPAEISLSTWKTMRREVFFTIIARDISERQKAQEKLLRYQERLRAMASDLALAVEQERRRIATGLHDSICQTLAFTKLRLQRIQRKEQLDEKALTALTEVCEFVDQAIQEARTLTSDLSRLSPPVLYEVGLEAALKRLVEEMSEQHGITIEFEDDGEEKPIGNDIRVVLFQSAREALINAAKHSRAGKVVVRIRKDRRMARLEIEDDGVGFDPSDRSSNVVGSGGFGLVSLRERLAHMGGSMSVESAPGKGTKVAISAPMKPLSEPPSVIWFKEGEDTGAQD
ncbi:MAG TPA: PAS domain S-box protein [Candidatus Brocadiia bacterium]|nr:PAS domain S-box protein [Candidatus Brocadiia bacterium]